MYYVQNTDDTAPASTEGTGTYASSGTRVTGTTTTFTTEVSEGDYLVSDTEKTVRKIKKVLSDTVLVLEEAFPSNVSAGETFKYIKRIDAKVVNLSVGAGTSGTSVDGQALAAGDSVNLEVSQEDKFSGKNFVTPVYVEGSTVGDAKILIQYFKK